jgi:hypothetical protein
VIQITPFCSGHSYNWGMAISSRFAFAPSAAKLMTVATAPARTRKPKATAANLIASEFAAYQPLPAAQPAAPAAPIPASSASRSSEVPSAKADGSRTDACVARPVILVFILAVAATLLFRLALATVPVINYGIKKLVKFVATQRGGRAIDFRVYDPIFG